MDAGRATIERLDADIEDGTLLAPRDGRIQYRVTQPGEIVAAGGKVLNMIDVSDAFFLPTDAAGRVALGAEVHLVLDAAPQYVIPAKATFVADVAKFTPKTVETLEEREKLMFRVKATIDPDLLRKYIRNVKTGLPGMAYVRLDPRVEWPAECRSSCPNDGPSGHRAASRCHAAIWPAIRAAKRHARYSRRRDGRTDRSRRRRQIEPSADRPGPVRKGADIGIRKHHPCPIVVAVAEMLDPAS